MFDEPEESPEETALSAGDRVKDKTDEFRMAAELFAVFEATRKFDAQIRPDLDRDLAREIQRTMGRLEKAKTPDSPVLPEASAADAASVLDMANARELATNDYHVQRRPGEVMIVRWLAGDEVETFYGRLQAHFDAAMEGFREEERQQQAWKQDPKTLAFLDALDKAEVKMAERYLRPFIRTHNLYVLSTQSADELNINYLADYVMSVPASEIVGGASAPPDEAPTERDLAWFFKLFSLRGVKDGVERMCFFAFLQKSDEDAW
jgi:hypothetical protein